MLKDEIISRWKEAFKARDTVLKSAYECVKAKILVEEKSGKHTMPLSDDIIRSVIVKEIKELKETQTFYQENSDMYVEFERKITALSVYLPKQLTAEEVKDIISKYCVTETNKGKIIGLTVKEVGSRFDKSKIGQLVTEVLSSYKV